MVLGLPRVGLGSASDIFVPHVIFSSMLSLDMRTDRYQNNQVGVHAMLRTNPKARHENAAPDPGGAAPNRTSSRHYHGLDLLRSVALLLGVIFHAAMPVLTPEYLGLGQEVNRPQFAGDLQPK
jgi:hypothetical protein